MNRWRGYDQYTKSLLADRYQKIPSVLRKGMIEPLGGMIPDSLPQQNPLRRAKHMLNVAGLAARRTLFAADGTSTPEMRRSSTRRISRAS